MAVYRIIRGIVRLQVVGDLGFLGSGLDGLRLPLVARRCSGKQKPRRCNAKLEMTTPAVCLQRIGHESIATVIGIEYVADI